MESENKLPERKPTRLKAFDYSREGAYFVTICTRDRMKILSDVIKTDNIYYDMTTSERNLSTVGEGLAPPEFQIRLKPCGEIVKEQLLLITTRFPTVTVEDYAIMPDHIHAIIYLHGDEETGGASPSPTLNDVVCALKSLSSQICKQLYGVEKMFQRSYADHIIRDKEDYETRRKYIYENPMRWYYKYIFKGE